MIARLIGVAVRVLAAVAAILALGALGEEIEMLTARVRELEGRVIL